MYWTWCDRHSRQSTSCRVAVAAVRDVWPEVVDDGITPSNSVVRTTSCQSSSLVIILFLPRSSAMTVSFLAEITVGLPPTFLWSSVTFRLDCRYTRTLELCYVNTLSAITRFLYFPHFNLNMLMMLILFVVPCTNLGLSTVMNLVDQLVHLLHFSTRKSSNR